MNSHDEVPKLTWKAQNEYNGNLTCFQLFQHTCVRVCVFMHFGYFLCIFVCICIFSCMNLFMHTLCRRSKKKHRKSFKI